MAFQDLPEQERGVQLLQRSLERGRLAHAYLFTGHSLDDLEILASTLARTLNCQQPVRGQNKAAIDSCDKCVNCRKILNHNHADVHWLRPESKSRVIRIEQARELMREMHLKPTEAEYKVAVIVAADRLHVSAANALLKTLEEPPAKSVLILLTTESRRVLETVQSRCLRLNFAGEAARPLAAGELDWLASFSRTAAGGTENLLARYRLLDGLLQKLNAMKSGIEEDLTARSPLPRYEDAEKEVREKWEEELAAAIEAEYRRQRTDVLLIIERWLRDIWLLTLAAGGDLLNFPGVAGTEQVARRITPGKAFENLQNIERTQRLLYTNVQESLALEVGLLKLHL